MSNARDASPLLQPRWWRVVLLALVTVLAVVEGAAAQRQQAAWPPLERQLARDRVIPGSALARLIAENQDFARLSEKEATDRLPIPPWLRVLWRKNHPDQAYSPNDPTGGYPLVLKEIYEWMLTHQDLQPGPPAEPAVPLRSATVGGNLRLSGAQISPRSESQIRINPWDPMKILGASNNIQASGQQAQFYSTDGGTSWGQSYLPLQPGDSFHSDPTVEWTSDGTAWATTIGINAAETVLQLRSYRSPDNGATWTFDNTFSGAQTSTDKQMTWVDRSLVSPYRDTMYAIWHTGAPVFMNRRIAAGWQTPVQVSGAETTGTGMGTDVRTNSAGDVFAFWPDTGSSRIYEVKSTTGGASYGSPVTVATTFDSYDIGIPAFNSRRALIYVTAAAYKTSCTSRVYAAWTDLTGAPGCSGPANEPGFSTASACKTRIWFSRSTNGGAAWSAPAMINNQASLNDQFNPWMVVDETNGRLAITYYDTVADPGRKQTHVYYQSSVDGGTTWSAPTQVTTAPTDETTAGTNGNQYGDYNGLSGQAEIFFPSWTDRRGGGAEEVWTARIGDPGGTGPDPSIQPWGWDQVPRLWPYWQTPDIWVDNNANGFGNEPGEPSRGKADNKLKAQITNRGSAAASGYTVVFKFKPYTTNASAPAVTINSLSEPLSLAPGAAKVYGVDWDLTDAFLQTHFDPMFWTTDHFCVQVEIQPACGVADDANPANNFAQNNFDNVPLTAAHAWRTQFFLYNHLDRPAIAALSWAVRAGNERVKVSFFGVKNPDAISLQPHQWLAVTAEAAIPEGITLPAAAPVALVDVTQRLDGQVVGGLTMALRSEALSAGSGGPRWFAGVATGGNWPLSSMADRYAPSFTFAADLEAALRPSLRLGLQLGYHAFVAQPVLQPQEQTARALDNLGVFNLSLLGRWLGMGGVYHPFVAVGPGAYRVEGQWKPGVQLGFGLEAPVTGRIALRTGVAAHRVDGTRAGDLLWIDASLGFVLAIP